MTIFIIVDL